MAGGSGEHSVDWGNSVPELRDALQLYFRKDEAKTLVMKVTAINHTLDYLKGGLAAVALGLTLVKADFTLFKVDEKGISWIGGTLKTWPWAKEGHDWWRKIMPDRIVRQFDEKESKKTEEREADKREVREYVDRNFYKTSHATHLGERIDKAKRSADRANGEIAKLRSQLRSAAAAGTPKASVPRDVKKNVNDLRASVNALSTALAGI